MRRKWPLIGVAAYLALCLIGGAFFVERTLRRPRRPVSASDRLQAGTLAHAVDAKLETISMAARDAAVMRAWLFTPAGFNSHSIVLLHGIGGNRTAMLGPARMFLEHGYRVLAVDLRAHGDSDGPLVTFGALEADDVRRWIDRVKGPEGSCVYSFGGSLGGLYALQASDAPGLCGVISTSGEASLREIAFDRIGQRLHTGPWLGRTLLRPGVELGFLYARVRYGVDLAGASAFPPVAGPGAPIFVIQGSDDDIVPPRHAQLIQTANPSRVSVWIVPGGSHAPAAIAPEEYARRVLDFVETRRRPWRDGRVD